jgi:hypothetical protein
MIKHIRKNQTRYQFKYGGIVLKTTTDHTGTSTFLISMEGSTWVREEENPMKALPVSRTNTIQRA